MNLSDFLDAAGRRPASAKDGVILHQREERRARRLIEALAVNPSWGREKNDQGWTALHLAARSGRADLARALLPLSDPSEGNDRGETALAVAAVHGEAECVKALLGAPGAKEKSRDGATPLMLAVSGGQVDCARALLPASDAKAANNHGVTALMIAARWGFRDCAQALWAASDAEAKDRGGRTALDWAVSFEKTACADFIASRMSTDRARWLREEMGAGVRLPLCEAQIERDELQKAMGEAPAGRGSAQEQSPGDPRGAPRI